MRNITLQRNQQREWKRVRTIRYRKEAIELLGGKCVKCDNKDIRVLQIDHIKAIRRKWKGISGGSFELVAKIVKGKVNLKLLQLLCANCHVLKTIEDRKGFKYQSKHIAP